ncbi:sulfatase [Persicirhabdus sediminis]|uniref:Sulfatase n=1 Tax=Persicirhabdus sediminis TaxID=454144 RepID=A0A8J7MD10_9BACT|nr:sulfatase [Persicirhabdus sediminis]MBK1790282.1 sulfatase [Persicirhabdus sediminis]
MTLIFRQAITKLNALACLTTGALCLSTGAQPEEKPNIIFFLIDDMGLMDTSVPFITDEAGQPKIYPLNQYYHTPAMEMLASRGHRFETFYANSVCSPSRISIMTGQSSARHRSTQWINQDERNAGPDGWRWDGIAADQVTLPKVLRQNGYRTIHIGKGHYGPLNSPAADPKFIGFDINIGGCSIGSPASYSGKDNYRSGIYHVPHLEAYHGTDTHLTDALTIEACKQIDKSIADGKPFFLQLAHYALHAPFQPDPRFADKYSDEADPLMPAYASLVEGMDKSLGDLISHLEDKGLGENTILFFLGDNGSDAPYHGRKSNVSQKIGSSAPLRGKKGTHYDGGMRVPFIASWVTPTASSALQKKWPLAQNQITSKEHGFASIEDLFPTTLELAGCDAPAGHPLDGSSMLGVLATANSASMRNEFLMHFPHAHRSSYFTVFRQGPWKIIYHYNKPADQAYELFNLLDDPTEAHNLARSQPERLKHMAASMQLALNQAGAQYMKDKPILP